MGSSYLIPAPPLGGWSRKQLIELADRRTDRRGSKTLDLDSEFLLALQEFCMETRWPWRRKTAIFALTAGTWQYDLSQVDGANAGDLHQFVKHGVNYYPNAGQPQNGMELTPMFERELQTAAIYANLKGISTGPPQKYFIMPGSFPVLCVTPVPTQGYPITIDYWSVPNVTLDSLPEAIPLVPAFLHHVLLKKLEAHIFRYTIGEGAARYTAALGEYKALVEKYQGSMAMVPGEQQNWSADDDYDSSYSTGHSAVQSTH